MADQIYSKYKSVLQNISKNLGGGGGGWVWNELGRGVWRQASPPPPKKLIMIL